MNINFFDLLIATNFKQKNNKKYDNGVNSINHIMISNRIIQIFSNCTTRHVEIHWRRYCRWWSFHANQFGITFSSFCHIITLWNGKNMNNVAVKFFFLLNGWGKPLLRSSTPSWISSMIPPLLFKFDNDPPLLLSSVMNLDLKTTSIWPFFRIRVVLIILLDPLSSGFSLVMDKYWPCPKPDVTNNINRAWGENDYKNIKSYKEENIKKYNLYTDIIISIMDQILREKSDSKKIILIWKKFQHYFYLWFFWNLNIFFHC